MTPDGLPMLSKGAHDSPARGACFMEYASFLAGEPWSDSPACTMPLLATAARMVNDRVDDETRQSLAVHIPRVIGTATDDLVLQARLAVWCARYVLPLVPEQDRAVRLAAIDAAEGWCNGTVAKEECHAVYVALYVVSANPEAAMAAGYAVSAAANAAYPAAADTATVYAANAVIAAARALTYASDLNARAAFLLALLDEHDRLTGRSAQRLTSEQAARLCAVTS